MDVDANAPWYTGSDLGTAGFSGDNAASELKGYLENRGWAALKPHEVALHAIKSHREAERHLGVPPAQILRLPRDAGDTAAWTELRSKLGVPADGKYDTLTGLKFKDGTDVGEQFTTDLAKILHQADVRKDVASTAAKSVIEMMDRASENAKVEYETKIAAEKDALTQNWGNRYNQNMTIVQNTAAKLGISKEQINAMEKMVGFKDVHEVLLKIGQTIGEDQFVSNLVGGNREANLTIDQARESLAMKMADENWVKRLEARDATVLKEFDTLSRLVTPQG